MSTYLGQWENLNREHVREVLEALSRSEHNERESRLEILTTHLLKWRFDSASEDPQRGWRLPIREQRDRILRLPKRSPSFRPLLPTVRSENYPHARMMAIDKTDLSESTLPDPCPWPVEQILADDFWPEMTPSHSRVLVARLQLFTGGALLVQLWCKCRASTVTVLLGTGR
jgi:hypothetical protein